MDPLKLANEHAGLFTKEFMDYLPQNLHVYQAFEHEALKVARKFEHYSARTIIEFLRHYSALEEVGGAWKLNNDNTPYLARLFVLAYPQHVDLFEFREAKAAKRDRDFDVDWGAQGDKS